MFKIYNAMRYNNMPSNDEISFSAIFIIYHWAFSTNKGDFSQSVFDAWVATNSGAIAPEVPIVVNVENFDMNTQHGIDQQLLHINAVRQAFPGNSVGIYGYLPNRDYWKAQSPGSAGYLAWQAQNDARAELFEAVDVLYPSLYTFYDNQAGHVKYMEENIKEAKRLGQHKPILAFMLNTYHPSSTLAGSHIDAEYWTLQLETLASLGLGGAVFWSADTSPWCSDFPWFRATQRWRAKRLISQLGVLI